MLLRRQPKEESRSASPGKDRSASAKSFLGSGHVMAHRRAREVGVSSKAGGIVRIVSGMEGSC